MAQNSSRGNYHSRSQSLRPLDQRSENESSWSNHFEITEFCPSGFTAQSVYGTRDGACLKWLLRELSFSDCWSRGTKTLGARLDKYNIFTLSKKLFSLLTRSFSSATARAASSFAFFSASFFSFSSSLNFFILGSHA